MRHEFDAEDAAIRSAARSSLKAAQSLARDAVSQAERRCFESLSDRIQLAILAAKGDPLELARVGPAANGLTLVEMLMIDDRADKFLLAKAILRQWFWPRDSQSVEHSPQPHRPSRLSGRRAVEN